jgi:hypothetical protein
MLYIHFRVLRYVYRTIFDFNLNYVNIDILPLKPLTHTNRFALPYIRINDNNTIINFGSVYFEKYIDGLTDSTQQMGGGKGMWSWLGGPASSAEAETEAEEPGTKAEEPGTVSSFQDLVKEITQLIQREKKMKVGVDKIRLQETILQYSYLHRENLNQRLTRELQKQQQHQQLNESKLKLIKNKIKEKKRLTPSEEAIVKREIVIKKEITTTNKNIDKTNDFIKEYEKKREETKKKI